MWTMWNLNQCFLWSSSSWLVDPQPTQIIHWGCSSTWTISSVPIASYFSYKTFLNCLINDDVFPSVDSGGGMEKMNLFGNQKSKTSPGVLSSIIQFSAQTTYREHVLRLHRDLSERARITWSALVEGRYKTWKILFELWFESWLWLTDAWLQPLGPRRRKVLYFLSN